MGDSTVEEDGGGDFTTLAAALADAGTGNTDTITIQAAWDNPDTTECTVADNDITIQTDATSKHIGRPWKAAETTYRLWTTDGHTITVNGTGLTIDGLDIQNDPANDSDECIRHVAGGASVVTIKNSILGFDSRRAECDVFYQDEEEDLTLNIENCMFYNVLRGVVDIQDVRATVIINVNCCSGYDVGFSATSNTRSGLVGCNGANVANVYNVNIFNTFIEINTGFPTTFHSVGGPTNNLSIDRSITNIATWLNADADMDTFTDGDNTESATFADTTGAPAVIIVDDDASPFDLRLQSHANNIAQDAHADDDMDNEEGGQDISIPATDILGTVRPQNTNHDIGAFEIEVAAAVGGVLISLNHRKIMKNLLTR